HLRPVRAVRPTHRPSPAGGAAVRLAVRRVQERRAVAPLGPPGSGDNPVRRRYEVVAIVAAIVVVLDQLAKWWALRTLDDHTIHIVGSLRLALTFNKAGAFGLGSTFVPLLALVAVGLVLVVVVRGGARPTVEGDDPARARR